MTTTRSPDPDDASSIDARAAQGPQFGRGNVQRNYFGGRAPVTWPCMAGVLPPLADSRQNRPADRKLADATGTPGTVVVCQVIAGMGGVGKTQLAAALAHRRWAGKDVDLLVWVTATSRTSIVSAYSEAARKVTGLDDPDQESSAGRFLAWAAERHGRRWLIVLDDLADPNDLAGLWPPDAPTGRTVVTTRRRDPVMLDGRELVDVDVFTPTESLGYLRDKLGDQPDRLDRAAELADDLGHLPLALAQAAAYIRSQRARMTCARYRDKLADQRRLLADLAPAALPDQHQETVAATWRLSIDRANSLRPVGVARPLLEVAALLDPNGIPAGLFATAALTDHVGGRLGREVDADDVDEGLQLLHQFNLVDIEDDADSVRVHALVQRAVREACDVDRRATVSRATADALVQTWPRIERDAGHAQALRSNTAYLRRVAGRLLWTDSDGGHVALFRAGNSLGETGQVGAAIDYFADLHGTAVDHLGPDHPDILTTRNNIASWRGHAGDPAGAATAFQDLLTDQLRVLGPDHPDTLTTRSNLASWRGHAGDPVGAATAFQNLLADRLHVLGPDHPDTFTTRANLAYWRGEAGDPAGAATAFQDLLDDRLRVLGPDHPDTLTTRNNLAYWRGHAGDPAGAAAAFQDLLDDRLRVLGPDHPDTLTTRNNIASWRGHAGNPASAAEAFQDLLTDRLRVLGPDHPGTLTTRNNIASWRGHAGDPAGAAAAFQDLLTDRLRVLGPDHPDTLTTRNNIAHWHGKAGDPARAATALEDLLADQLRVLGHDHPDTLTTRNNIAYWQGKAGDPAGAAASFQDLLADQLRVLGPDHPDALITRNNIAHWREAAGGVQPGETTRNPVSPGFAR
ncbi:tetratricopeptide repeat protein [Virgisporangium ochraceum]|uniref:ATP-binding protein n=1 Tax=Virgisporangium ochraceum TaxID=65505 RepID=A0A8J4EDK8_9ACTN|nr:tetratricopeptide repeat protein [Virgisporangium ochraceum]GIJ68052.1 ATP-binding protein [Virgisporangium ochraceum]